MIAEVKMMFVFSAIMILIGSIICKNSYLITTPKELRPGTMFSIGVNILKAPKDVHIEAQLVMSGAVITTTNASIKPISADILRLHIPENLQYNVYQIRIVASGGLSFSHEKAVNYNSKSISVFIQTDKAIYNAGQTVNFRTFALYSNMTVYKGPIDLDIYDTSKNKIKQWLGVFGENGVFTNSMVMDKEPVFGNWKIKATINGISKEQNITIKQYVLPRFEISLDLPSAIPTTTQDVLGSVKALYTYGKPVVGRAEVRAKFQYWNKPWNYNGAEPIVEFHNITLDSDGKSSFRIPLNKMKLVGNGLNDQKLLVEAYVTELLTKATLSVSKVVPFQAQSDKIEFLPASDNSFKPGLDYTAYIHVTQDGFAANERVTLKTVVQYEEPIPPTIPSFFYGPQIKKYSLPDKVFSIPTNGIVRAQLSIPNNATQIQLQAIHKSVNTYKTVSQIHSSSDSYIQVSLNSDQLQSGSTALFTVTSTEGLQKLFYQIWARGEVLTTHIIDGTGRKTIKFSVFVTTEMTPDAMIVVYYVRPDGEIVLDALRFKIEASFQNKVSMTFNKQKAKPGDNITVTVKADPYSSIHLLVVDKSVKILQSGNDITKSEIFQGVLSHDPLTPSTAFPNHYGGSDAYDIIGSLLFNVLTDARIFKYIPFIWFATPAAGFIPTPAAGILPPYATPRPYFPGVLSELGPGTFFKPVERVREMFPETWLWSNGTTGANGVFAMNTTFPDTMTTWIGSAFVVNQATGFGVSSSAAQVVGFQQFFIKLNLPYSVVKGEEVAIQISVFNYMSSPVPVMVILKDSKDFKNIANTIDGHKQLVSETKTDSIYVKSGKAKSIFFPIVPQTLGPITIEVQAMSMFAADAVKRQLLVVPEGVPKEENTAMFLGLSPGQNITRTVDISLPASYVSDSAYVRVSVIGDFMGPTIHNLDNLLRMPTGCGEQTMIGLAPDVFVANYLERTGQLTKELRDKLTKYIEKGYQRELKYQLSDGSFSAWGDSDRYGSMWLSAFVVKTFYQAKRHIFIDDAILEKTITWIISKQLYDGSFPEPGRIIHKNMQGGSSKGQALTAFVLIALEESKNVSRSSKAMITTAIANANRYLENHASSTTNVYDQAIISYALIVSGSPFAGGMFTKFNSKASNMDGMRYWLKTSRPNKQSEPIDIEMTAYGLLVYSRIRSTGDGLKILKWLISQRNSNGGFKSTQDTVLALQALSEFTAFVHKQKPDIQITVTAGTYAKKFIVNSRNSLVLQSVELPSVPNQVNIKASGNGLALAEVAVFYNVKSNPADPSFSSAGKVERGVADSVFDVTVSMTKDTIDLIEVKTCARRRRGSGNGMAIAEIGIPTGFDVNTDDIPTVVGLRRIEEEDRKIVFYFNEINTSTICVSMTATRTGLVAKMKPSPVRVYDYYEPSNQYTSYYQSNVLTTSSICDVCHLCRPCRT